jgi:H+/Cl- antiporter ClcA
MPSDETDQVHASTTPGQPAPQGPPGAAPSLPDPSSLIRSTQYRRLLLVAALIGVVVSFASWCFLELLHYVQQWVFVNLPHALGYKPAPNWWPLPVLAVAGVLIAFAVARLPGNGGHEPSDGLKFGGPTRPVDLPGILLAAVASIGLGMVVGPEAPLIALGTGLAVLAVKLSRRDAPDQVLALLAASAAFAAISSLFGSPVVGAVIIIEASGLGGPTLPLILLPGLLSAGIGSLVFIGMGSVSGLSSSAYAILPLSLPAYKEPTLAAFAWTILLSIAVAVVALAMVHLGLAVKGLVKQRPFVVIPAAALVVAGLAIAFAEITGQSFDLVLFSGQDSMSPLVQGAATLSLGTLALIIVFKGLAYGVSLGSSRGGPTFPAMFLGIVAGLLAGHLPGFAQTPAVAALMGAALVSLLRLPLSSVLVATFVAHAGFAVEPLIIVAVVVAYITVLALSARLAGEHATRGPAPLGGPTAASTDTATPGAG